MSMKQAIEMEINYFVLVLNRLIEIVHEKFD